MKQQDRVANLGNLNVQSHIFGGYILNSQIKKIYTCFLSGKTI